MSNGTSSAASSDAGERIVIGGDYSDIQQGHEHLAEMIRAKLYLDGGDLDLEDFPQVRIEILDSGIEESPEQGGCLGGGTTGEIWVIYKLTPTSPSIQSSESEGGERSQIEEVATRMKADMDKAIKNRDSQTLSVIRTAAMENAVKLRGDERCKDLADQFQIISDAANEALLPLCGD